MFTLEAAVSGAGYLVSALAVGLLLTAAFFLTRPEDAVIRRRLLALVPAFFCALFVLGLFTLVVQGAKLSGGAFPSWDVLQRYLSRTQSGKIWLARELYLIALLALGLWLVRQEAQTGQARFLFFILLPLIASRGLTGHAAAVRENTVFMLAADAVHMTAVALWAGGLPFVFWIFWRAAGKENAAPAQAARIIRQFSRVALISVCLLIPSGLYQSLTHLQDWPALLNTAYGNVLSVKLILFASMLALGAFNRFSTKPALERLAQSKSEKRAEERIFYPIGWEGLLGISVLAMTGFLTTLPPGAHSAHGLSQTQGSGSSSHAHTSSPVRQAEPPEGAGVKILVPRNGQVFAGDRIPLGFALTKGKRGHHVHAYVDGELVGMFASKDGALSGVKPGRHVLELRVVAEDHQTELDANDRVDFTVQ